MPVTEVSPLSAEDVFVERKRHHLRRRIKQAGGSLTFLVLVGFAANVCGVNLSTLASGAAKGAGLLSLFLPLWSAFPGMLQPLCVTALMAFAATLIGTLLSLPCALAASSNIAPRWLRYTTRFLIGLERGIPEIILLLFMVAVFGLGVFAGLLALSISSIGMLAKLLADATEEIEPQLLESIAVTGATHSQVIRYAVIPQILPSLFANALFRFGFTVRESVLLGAVGAGGIGYELSIAMSSLEYRRASVAIVCTLLLVLASERVSDHLRARILSGGQLI